MLFKDVFSNLKFPKQFPSNNTIEIVFAMQIGGINEVDTINGNIHMQVYFFYEWYNP